MDEIETGWRDAEKEMGRKSRSIFEQTRQKRRQGKCIVARGPRPPFITQQSMVTGKNDVIMRHHERSNHLQ